MPKNKKPNYFEMLEMKPTKNLKDVKEAFKDKISKTNSGKQEESKENKAVTQEAITSAAGAWNYLSKNLEKYYEELKQEIELKIQEIKSKEESEVKEISKEEKTEFAKLSKESRVEVFIPFYILRNEPQETEEISEIRPSEIAAKGSFDIRKLQERITNFRKKNKDLYQIGLDREEAKNIANQHSYQKRYEYDLCFLKAWVNSENLLLQRSSEKEQTQFLSGGTDRYLSLREGCSIDEIISLETNSEGRIILSLPRKLADYNEIHSLGEQAISRYSVPNMDIKKLKEEALLALSNELNQDSFINAVKLLYKELKTPEGLLRYERYSVYSKYGDTASYKEGMKLIVEKVLSMEVTNEDIDFLNELCTEVKEFKSFFNSEWDNLVKRLENQITEVQSVKTEEVELEKSPSQVITLSQ